MNELSETEKTIFSKRSDEFKICHGRKCNRKTSIETCLVCNSTKDSRCATNPSLSLAKVCDKYENQCFTYISSEYIIRGCLNDFSEKFQTNCETEKNRCQICSTPACNNVTLEMRKCIECDSAQDERCRDQPQKFAEKICDYIEPLHPKGCYLSIVSGITLSNRKSLIFFSRIFVFQ